MRKLCPYCNKLYPETDFGVAVTLQDKVYRRRKCRYCYKETKRQLYVRHRQWLDDYKRKCSCRRCGIKDYRVLDFHHSDHVGKEFNIGDFKRRYGFKKLEKEIEKCIVLCANCHRILHAENSRHINEELAIR